MHYLTWLVRDRKECHINRIPTATKAEIPRIKAKRIWASSLLSVFDIAFLWRNRFKDDEQYSDEIQLEIKWKCLEKMKIKEHINGTEIIQDKERKKSKVRSKLCLQKKVLWLNDLNENKIEIISFFSLFDITFDSMVS